MAEWRVLAEVPTYEISNTGQIRVTETGQFRSIQIDPSQGQCYISLRKGKQYLNRAVHVLVARTFIENTENKSNVIHINGDRLNNSAANLRWATLSEKRAHTRASEIQADPIIPKDNEDDSDADSDDEDDADDEDDDVDDDDVDDVNETVLTKLCTGCDKVRPSIMFNLKRRGSKCKECVSSYHRNLRIQQRFDPRRCLPDLLRSAKKRGLTVADEDKLCQKMLEACFYCNSSTAEQDQLSGIDRVDATQGYNDDNTVPCCSVCNYIKRCMSMDYFYERVGKIARYAHAEGINADEETGLTNSAPRLHFREKDPARHKTLEIQQLISIWSN